MKPVLTPAARRGLASVVLLGFAGFACAHTGADGGVHHESSLVEGLVHPFTGLDHVAAMLAVGAWSAAALRGARAWSAPVAFAVMLLAGALLARAGLQLPAVEPAIAASLLALGLLLAARSQLPMGVGAAVAGGFALFHGAAHGSALPQSASPAAALAGMLVGTVVLHLAGLGIGRMLATRSAWFARTAGALVAALGLFFLAGPAAAQLLN
ncbi:MAG: HupE/UreJ family protein [Aquabacterium sp.]|nr:MAG: HupE/UreJ family protein [Aquabacterium sp.]